MGLFGSLTAGVTGLLSQSESISVISDNLSNVNTIGYKNTRTLFDQQVTSAGLSGTIFNAGGVGTEFERFQNAQGAFLATQSSTDLALSGSGFFVVVDETEISSATGQFYTRAGAFTEDNRGFLTTPSGQYLLGWRTDSDGTIQDIQNPAPVELQSVGSSARATSELILGLNLTSTETLDGYDTSLADPLQGTVDGILADPTTSDFVTDVRFFDSQGAPRDATIAFSKRANNFWDWVAYIDGEEVTTDFYGNVSAGAGNNVTIAQGTMEFNANGSLKYATGLNAIVDWSGGVEDGDIDINMGDYTGGFIFDAPTVGGGLELTDGILQLTIDDSNPSLPAPTGGNYVFADAGVGPTGGRNIQLTDPAGGVFTVEAPTTSAVRTLEFPNGVTMTLSANFDATVAFGGGTATIPAVAEAPYDQGRGTNGVIQFAAPYNTLFANQDGFGSGTLASVSIDEEGFVVGSFTNGEAKKLWKVVVAVFQDPSELEAVGDNLLRETDGSGRPLFKEAGVGGTATIVSGALEQSTVDIAQEFSNMIVSQRAFQASSSIISTVDQMLNELLQVR